MLPRFNTFALSVLWFFFFFFLVKSADMREREQNLCVFSAVCVCYISPYQNHMVLQSGHSMKYALMTFKEIRYPIRNLTPNIKFIIFLIELLHGETIPVVLSAKSLGTKTREKNWSFLRKREFNIIHYKCKKNMLKVLNNISHGRA